MSTHARGESADSILKVYPWLDHATVSIPSNWDDVYRWARYFWMVNGDYSEAMRMVACYFITELKFKDVEDEEATELKNFYNDDFEWDLEAEGAGCDFLAYGEVCCTMYIPISRSVRCPSCGFEQPLKKANWEFKDWEFWQVGPCPDPNCNKSNHKLKRIDRKNKDMSRVRLVRWDPQDIDVAWNPVSRQRNIFLKIPRELQRDIEHGVPVVMHDLPWEFIECTRDKQDMEFHEDAVFYRNLRTISGVMTSGRGLPKSMSNYRLFWHIQTLNRQDQSIATDYITGPRIWSPAPQGTNAGQAVQSDPLLNRGGSDFVGKMNGILKAQRSDPTRHFTAPHPIQYQFAGGEGKQISPWELIQARKEELLQSSGVPVEFYRMNLTAQGAPMMLRLFEMMWTSLPRLYKALFQWTTDRLVQYYQTPEARVDLERTSIADDLERKNILLQLMAGNQVSPETALGPLGITDIREEIRKTFNHQSIMAEEQMKFDEEMMKKQEEGVMGMTAGMPTPSGMAQQQMMAQGGGMPPGGGGGGMMPPMGGDPMGGGGGGSMGEMQMQAEQMAQQLIGQDETSRKSQLINLKKSNETLHALVKSALEKLRQQMQTAGGAAMIQQNFGPGAAPPMM